MHIARLVPPARKLRLAGSVLAALSGFLHVSLAMVLFADREMAMRVFGTEAYLVVPGFFLVLGAFQIMWAWIMLGAGGSFVGIGILGFLGSIVLYLVALATPLPFGVIRQNITLLGGIIKLIEGAYVAVSLRIVAQ